MTGAFSLEILILDQVRQPKDSSNAGLCRAGTEYNPLISELMIQVN